MDNVLVLVRHGQSEWNRRNLFTGWCDPDLTEQGVAEAVRAGRLLKAQGFHFDLGFTSALLRANRTLSLILDELGQQDLETIRDQALNERNYGELSGLNKDEARVKWGDEKVLLWRRSYDIPPPGGESLKDTAARVLPFYKTRIWPAVKSGKNVIVTAHGNSIRALIMYLEELSAQQILEREVATGVPAVYRLTMHGHVEDRRDLVA
ncbi:2,3-bisphosphoglycerate-dependent phosphoglycerate mutase [Candidatus Filomicrobium marinum]|uniref:2,3-bisphosphoglycerate-dependent phosphoglycerate mutase n=2 Tax=Filomicrobium TaxID=119044 RepID=A0A0D6JCP0_9HYPH|nr:MULTISPECIES: 2,3-bisphosphoglycerate-dependent phosphoglycerate mutase [Filomicrobium]MCV0370630.1 2,3-bisphosphoglycerate-dependent phosphoglycerate mutase [Filomicrobium sp.]CFX07564.1 2,3-bisphosphoglycerate-dependent phosphoglycerate mutase [Candidatus Filomicrobium marinum]CPR16631.1 2,3-bisphosphoglycerate-dependent phosphoglycerate mutase [Candidatus Filomicrobium marinum]SDP58471.1 2,3-bisphosphoglycerate-dependent phosphoglycerate mutase [Filomicrobium insigne]